GRRRGRRIAQKLPHAQARRHSRRVRIRRRTRPRADSSLAHRCRVMVKFKIDENLPAEVLPLLTGDGHDAITVFDQQLNGSPDPDVAAACRREGRAIVTLALDFSDIRAYPPADYAGIIVLRLSRLDKRHVLLALTRLLPVLNQEPLPGSRVDKG